MHSDTSEYLDNPESEQQPKPQKVFDLKRAVDPETKVILQARKDVLRDPALRDGARVLFALLLDYSLDPRMWFPRKGSVMISTQKLSEHLSRSRRAIFGWTKQLIEQGQIWVSKWARPNTQAMNLYHLTALQPKHQTFQEAPADGIWGNGYRRPPQPMPAGARGRVLHKTTLLVDRFGNPVFSQLPQNEPATRKICASLPQNLRETGAQNDTCPEQILREGREQNSTWHPQTLRVAPANCAPSPEHKTAPYKESLDRVRDDQGTKGKGSPPAFELWKGKIRNWFPRELEKTKTELLKQQKEADPSESQALAELQQRIDCIDELLLGGKPPKKASKPKATAAKPAQPAEPTQEDIREGTKFLIDSGKVGSLTAAQKALAEAEGWL